MPEFTSPLPVLPLFLKVNVCFPGSSPSIKANGASCLSIFFSLNSPPSIEYSKVYSALTEPKKSSPVPSKVIVNSLSASTGYIVPSSFVDVDNDFYFESATGKSYDLTFTSEADGLYAQYIQIPEPSVYAGILGIMALTFAIYRRRK